MKLSPHQNTLRKPSDSKPPSPFSFLSEYVLPEPKSPADLERQISEAFTAWCADRRETFVVLKDPTIMKLYVRSVFENTRYHPKGRQKIKNKIHRRLGHYPAEDGILVTFTYCNEDYTSDVYSGVHKTEAWRDVGAELTRFWDAVNHLRKRRGTSKVKRYIGVMETQKERCYPAPHYFLPGLKWLAHNRDLQRLWPWGNVDITPVWRGCPSDYLLKYLTKMEGQESMMSFLWFHKIRLYTFSGDYVYRTEEATASKVRFAGSGGPFKTKELWDLLIEEGYTGSAAGLKHLRGG